VWDNYHLLVGILDLAAGSVASMTFHVHVGSLDCAWLHQIASIVIEAQPIIAIRIHLHHQHCCRSVKLIHQRNHLLHWP
jgi:hypothetical protein